MPRLSPTHMIHKYYAKGKLPPHRSVIAKRVPDGFGLMIQNDFHKLNAAPWLDGVSDRLCDLLNTILMSGTATQKEKAQIILQDLLNGSAQKDRPPLSNISVVRFNRLRSGSFCGSTVALSPDGKYIAIGSGFEDLCIYEPETGKLVKNMQIPWKDIASAQYSPDGRHLLLTNNSGAAGIWDVETGMNVHEFRARAERGFVGRFNCDGNKVISFCKKEQTVTIWESTSIEHPLFQSKHDRPISDVVMNGDESKALVIAGYAPIEILDIATGESLLQIHHGPIGLASAQWSPDERHIMTASMNGQVRIWNAETGDEVIKMIDRDKSLSSAIYSRDGSEIYGVAMRSIEVWNTYDGFWERALVRTEDEIRSFTLSQDGERALVSHGNKTEIIDVRTGRRLCTMKAGSELVSRSEWTADEARVLTVSRDGAVRIWELETTTKDTWRSTRE